MVGITFGNKHSFEDYGLILSSKSISSPSAKISKVDITGADGVLDLTEFFGDVNFQNRTLKFEFKKQQSRQELIEEWSILENELHGKKVKIILDEEPDFYFVGRLSLAYSREKNITTITFTCDCEPYKMKNKNTIVEVNSSGNVSLFNLRKRVVPRVITTGEATIKFGAYTWNLGEGEFLLPELELVAGINTVEITTSSKVSFVYQEGGL